MVLEPYGYVEIEGSQLTPCMHLYGAELSVHAMIRGAANEVMSACTSVLSLMVLLNVASTSVRWCSYFESSLPVFMTVQQHGCK